jgi:L-alanine-DL-glutamate epimerase-like enolase superfamily enzyme
LVAFGIQLNFNAAVKLTFKRVELRLAHLWKLARTRATDTRSSVVVQLVDSDGCAGTGEAAPVARYDESAETVEAFLRKVDSRKLSFADIAGSLDYIGALSSGDSSAKCAVSIALHDGAARRAKKSLHDFLGLGFKDRTHVTSFTIGIDRPDVIRKKVLAAEEFPILKMKAGSDFDAANLRALREAAPAKPLRIDANEAWTEKEQALERIERLAADRKIQFIEQPMPASAPEADWIWLKQRSPLAIFGDESFHFASDVERAAECFHGVNVKLVKTGGLNPAIDALCAARKAGLKTMIGCMIETSVLVSAAAHLAELADYLDLDGNLLITNDPYRGVTARKGTLSFAHASEKFGLRVNAKS